MTSRFLLSDRDQNCFCIENLKLIFWKTGKCVKNILIYLSPFSCLASEPTVAEHSSHTFTTLPNAKPFCPWSTFVWWVLNTKLVISILLNISKGSQQISLVIANISSAMPFSTIIPERRYIYFFSILLDCTRCPDSTGALNCRMLVFQISFFPVCRIYFSITHSIAHPFFFPKP